MPKLEAPKSGVIVRMYRIGHGDCFLLTFPKKNDKPFFMLIDCGLKSGSEVPGGPDLEEVVQDIHETTDGFIDLVVITHEHEDHVNGFWRGEDEIPFKDIKIGAVWLAWTEDPDDDDANDLRERYEDTLLNLVKVSQELKQAGVTESLQFRETLLDLLGFELGADTPDNFGADKISGITNKQAIQYIRHKAKNGVHFLEPHQQIYDLPNVAGVKVYPLGPPKNENLLLSLDPHQNEAYSQRFQIDAVSTAFFSALGNEEDDPSLAETFQPFAPRYRIPQEEVLKEKKVPYSDFFAEYLHKKNDWRRIDGDWLAAAEMLALRLNSEVNNTSLVLAIELPKTKKVLLFTGDAQRGNWISWTDGTWQQDDGSEVTAKELLSRTVLYKVGHHGSHNATLKGTANSDYANLQWMGQGQYKSEFVAMIPANKGWAYGKSRPWKHPLKSIERALERKTKGRLFRTDQDKLTKPEEVEEATWKQFMKQVEETRLYLQYHVEDK
ncbi:MAG: hypothetical protein KDC44_02440 [Phaeodactylibacter sp.]|nr:hypothetical protein [Phaeodactylibacter sp.]